ncbi:LPS export ABC transporter periplasmic protein LptC [Candidatus Dependentiae bacterium]|nr:LPS export ABC transporter periplasmic protein LptC [Candidatus Dependentiae bacterium]
MSKLFISISVIILLAGLVLFRSRKKEKSGTTTRILAEQAYKEIKQKSPANKLSPEVILKETDLYVFDQDNIKACHIQAQESKIHKNGLITLCKQSVCTMTTNKSWTATLHAPRAVIDHENKTILFPKTVTGSIDQNKNNSISIQAQKGTVDLKTKTINLYGVTSTLSKLHEK